MFSDMSHLQLDWLNSCSSTSFMLAFTYVSDVGTVVVYFISKGIHCCCFWMVCKDPELKAVVSVQLFHNNSRNTISQLVKCDGCVNMS